MGQLSPAFTDYLAGTKGTKTTEDDAREFAQKVGRAIYSGDLGRLQRQFSFTNEEAKLFKGWKSAEKRIALLTKGIEKLHKDNRQKLAESIPGKQALSDYKVGEMWAEAGKKLMPIKDEWKELRSNMTLSLRPFINLVADVGRGSFDWMKETLGYLKSPEYTGVWKELGGLVKEVSSQLAPIKDSLATLVSPLFIADSIANIARSLNWLTGTDLRGTDGKDYGPAIADDANMTPNRAFRSGVRSALGHGANPLQAYSEGYIRARTIKDRANYADRQAEVTKIAVQESIERGVTLGTENSANILREAVEKGLTSAAAQKAYVDIVSMRCEGASKETVLKELESSKEREAVKKALPGSGDDQLIPEQTPKKAAKHAAGGIFRRAHLGMVAEAGSEAVIPLRRDERSLGLLGAAADAIGVKERPVGQTIHKTFSPSITVKVNVNDSRATEIGQLVADAVSNVLKNLEKEDYRESWA